MARIFYGQLMVAALVFFSIQCWAMDAGSGQELNAEATPPREVSSPKPSEGATEQLESLHCPQGLERFVPGTYYWCVGARALGKKQYDHSRSMLQVAAAWGSKGAQFTLGLGYFNGGGGKLDRPLGLAWLKLAAERQDPKYTAILASAWQKATPQEQVRADVLVQEMLPKYGDARAAKRAQRIYLAERRALTRDIVSNAKTCIAGLTTKQLSTIRAGDTACVGAQPVEAIAKQLDVYADANLEGWIGHVRVGGIEEVSPDKP